MTSLMKKLDKKKKHFLKRTKKNIYIKHRNHL